MRAKVWTPVVRRYIHGMRRPEAIIPIPVQHATQAQPDSLMSIKITRRHLYEVASLAKLQQQLHQQSRQAKERMLLEHEQMRYHLADVLPQPTIPRQAENCI